MAAILLILRGFGVVQQSSGPVSAYGQCGGSDYTGPTDCVAGYTCAISSSTYSECVPAAVLPGEQAPWGQCGGQSYSGFTQCSPGYFCSTLSSDYSQCIPSSPDVFNSFEIISSASSSSILSSSFSSTRISSSTLSGSFSSTGSTSSPVSPSPSSSSRLLSSSSTASTKASSTSSSSSQQLSDSLSRTSSSAEASPSSKPLSSSSSSTLITTVTSQNKKKSTSSLSINSSSTRTTSSSSSYLSKLLSSSGLAPITKLPSTSSKKSTTALTSTSSSNKSVTLPPPTRSTGLLPQQTAWGQCGGTGWSGPSQCLTGWTCVLQAGNELYSQCMPDSAPSTPPTITLSQSSATKITVTMSASRQSMLTKTSATSSQSCSASNSAPASAGKVAMTGINIAGCEFGTDVNGYQQPSVADCPLGKMYGRMDGPGQMLHFVRDDKFNVFRLPVGWQYLTNNANTATGTLDRGNSGKYDYLVQQCLITGAYCVIDLHNYARFNGAIIGQGGPSNAVFASLWASIAARYKPQKRVIFGLMNEAHDVPNMMAWKDTVQAAVTAIRNAGALTQMILLPGNNWTSSQSFVSDGSGPALAKVTNPDHTTTNLIFDIHKYLAADGSRTSTECVDNYITKAFEPLAQWLRCNRRMALLSEIGGGSTSSCETYLCQTVAFLNANSDIYLGYIGWAAGSFDSSYALVETPTSTGGMWADTQIVTECLVPK